MRLNPFLVYSAAAFTLSCVVTAATLYYKSRTKDINDVLVFRKLQFNPWSCFDKMIGYIEAAETSVKVCMPKIHNPAIQGRLLKTMKEKNIKVQIIININECADSTDFLLQELIEAGAEVKCKVYERQDMQHKFCLVDDNTLMTGTLNWGDDRSSDDWNYVYVTNKPSLVEPVKKDFNQMWSNSLDLENAIKVESVLYESGSDISDDQPEEISDIQSQENISVKSQ